MSSFLSSLCNILSSGEGGVIHKPKLNLSKYFEISNPKQNMGMVWIRKGIFLVVDISEKIFFSL